MILDADGNQCHELNFNIASSTTTTSRAWTILATQFACGQEDISGPPGCLQYYTQTANTIEKCVVFTSKSLLDDHENLSITVLHFQPVAPLQPQQHI